MNYWLFKSESDVFSIDDLERCPNSTASWEGVRNYQARNFLRDSVKLGDLVFFYHSRVEPIGIVGTMVVVKEGYPDLHAFDKKSPYYDPKSKKEKPTWFMVDVKLKDKFKNLIPTQNLRKFDELKNMTLLQKGSRLSIQPVTESEFLFIINMNKP